MVFSSVTFLVYFLPIVVCLYYLAPAGMRNLLLLVTSLFFYAWGEPVYVVLMIFSIVLNYFTGIVLDYALYDKPSATKLIVGINVLLNLSILGFFKYADFLVNNLNSICGTNIELLNLPLPIGISFYTFQAMSYIIDLYRGKVQVQKDFVAFGTYIALFPQLIAGPIVRFKSIEEQLVYRIHSWENFSQGAKLFIIGMGKKVILANNVGMLWDSIAATEVGNLSVATAWIGAIAFTMQIYFDFSGYSDMAIGLGKMFGFDFPKNFDYPYLSRSVTEFWRRWHISLSSWFREYVYVPLGGNRKGLVRQLLNILIVWSLTGLWHGASWNFVIWGMYFAVLLIAEKIFLANVLNSIEEKLGIAGKMITSFYAMFVVVISWVIFASEDLNFVLCYVGNLFGLGNVQLFDNFAYYTMHNYWIILITCAVGVTKMPAMVGYIFLNKDLESMPKLSKAIETVVLLIILLVSFAYIVASTYNPFLYFRF